MNKSEIIDRISAAADISKAAAQKALEAFTECITEALVKEDPVTLVGFGTFVVRTRSARNGRNPKTGQTITIAEAKNTAFKAGKLLKDAVQGQKESQ